MTIQQTIETIAIAVAIDAKASGIGVRDLGCFYDDAWNLTAAEWAQVCNRAIALYPAVTVPPSIAKSWANANADFRAEERFERMICAGA